MDGQKLPSQRRTAQSQPSQERRQPFPPLGPTATRGQPSAQSSTQQGLQTQDWVCEPPERRRPGRHWSVSIDERRRLAMLGGPGRPGAGSPSRGRDIMQIVAQLVSEDVDRDVLFSHPPDSAESSAFRAFLSRSATFWRKATLRSPPS
uniref:Testis expressed 22 n=1 Tax=Prolemur simus TaxID=1328070 RepID=A0A8C9AHD2_PROSS